MTCKNCDAPLTGKFCGSCGQKADTHRITLSQVTHDFLHAFTHADKGFLLLTKRLITKSGFVAKEYIDGKRKKYFNPLSFLVITSTAENFVLNSFIVAESHVIRTLIFIPWFLLFPESSGMNLAVFESSLLVYIIIAYRQFFNQHILLTILKGILTMVFFIVLYWVFILAYVYLKNLLF